MSQHRSIVEVFPWSSDHFCTTKSDLSLSTTWLFTAMLPRLRNCGHYTTEVGMGRKCYKKSLRKLMLSQPRRLEIFRGAESADSWEVTNAWPTLQSAEEATKFSQGVIESCGEQKTESIGLSSCSLWKLPLNGVNPPILDTHKWPYGLLKLNLPLRR